MTDTHLFLRATADWGMEGETQSPKVKQKYAVPLKRGEPEEEGSQTPSVPVLSRELGFMCTPPVLDRRGIVVPSESSLLEGKPPPGQL